MKSLSPRESVERVLRGEILDRVPFTIYEERAHRGSIERELRNGGLCLVRRTTHSYRMVRPNVKQTQHVYWQGERKMVRTLYETPVGNVTTVGQDAGFTIWMRERMLKSPDDYKAIRFLIDDEVYEPTYEAFARAQEECGPDFTFRENLGLEPLQALISGHWMDMEAFCVEWMERRDEVLNLYEAIVAKRRALYPIVAKSPALHVNYGGNVVAPIIGPKNFETYYLPHYNEAAEILHRHNKLIGCHYDDDCALLAPLIARTDLDYVEAFSPMPDTDMTLGQARAAWPDKVIWLNFPSSVHLRPDAEVEQKAVDLLNEVDSVWGIIMGVTEDMPTGRWQAGCRAIQRGLERHAREHADKYK